MSIKHIVLDMGGVLVKLKWLEIMNELTAGKMNQQQLFSMWEKSPAVLDFETGKTNFMQYSEAFIKELNIDISTVKFQQRFIDILDGSFDGTEQVLNQLQQSFKVSILSNTNVAHYDFLQASESFFGHVDHIFTSHTIGVMKPEAGIYQAMLEGLNADPKTVAFFDDNQPNVDAAIELGMSAYLVKSPQDVLAICETL